jgi:arginyl-tRNA synthetase
MKAVEDFGIPDGRLRSSINPPPRPEFGELSSSICFDIARERGGSPKEIAGKVLGKVDYAILRYVLRVEEAGGGYVNFHLDYDRATPRILTEVLENSCEYGYVKAERPLRVVVEHTSVNPVHAIHIGQARNTVLGDSIARILKARGHSVKTRYYVDDMGRQSAILAYGYLKLGNGEVEGKIDHFLGSVYSLTNCILEVKSLKRRIEETQPERLEELNRLRARLDEWVSIAAELQEKHPSLFEKLTTLIEDDAETQVGMLIRDYERKKPSAVEAIRRVSALCLEGFKETLRKLEVEFDSWDWESDLVWSSVVGKILEELKRTGYVREVEGVLELESERIVDDFNLREKLQLTERYSLPPLTLARSDGTTLYTLRDIAYTLRKFEEAD